MGEALFLRLLGFLHAQTCTPENGDVRQNDDAEAGKEDDDAPANGEGGQGRAGPAPDGHFDLAIAECAREAHL